MLKEKKKKRGDPHWSRALDLVHLPTTLYIQHCHFALEQILHIYRLKRKEKKTWFPGCTPRFVCRWQLRDGQLAREVHWPQRTGNLSPTLCTGELLLERLRPSKASLPYVLTSLLLVCCGRRVTYYLEFSPTPTAVACSCKAGGGGCFLTLRLYPVFSVQINRVTWRGDYLPRKCNVRIKVYNLFT